MRRKPLLILILLAAAALRLIAIDNGSPPGPSHDEVANWLIDHQILDGQHAIYFQEAYGHEAGFHYLQAASISLLGDNVLALRLPAAFAGLLLLPLLLLLSAAMFHPRSNDRREQQLANRHHPSSFPVATLAMALLAVLFWSVFFSRQGLRAITLPLVAGLAAYFWWRGWHRAPHWPSMGVGGALAGLSLYTYMAARALPLIFLFYIAYLWLFHRPDVWPRRRGILFFLLAMIAVAVPMLLFLAGNPGAEFRISEIDAPLRALRAGDIKPVLVNSGRILGMVGFAGDPLWRQNIAGMPLFEPALALLTYGGMLIAVLRWRQPQYAFLLLWLLVGATPSIVTTDAPSFIRLIILLPVVPLLPILSLQYLHSVLISLSQSWRPTPWRPLAQRLVLGAAILLIAFHAARTGWGIFKQWPSQAEVRFVWQAALTSAARFLDDHPHVQQAALAGWTPGTMDPPTMQLAMKQDAARLLHFNPQQTLALPGSAPVWLLRPTILPLQPDLAQRLHTWGALVTTLPGGITSYELAALPQPAPAQPVSASFQGELALLGIDPLSRSLSDSRFISYWRVESSPGGPRRIFFHAVGPDGELLAQDDGLEAPARHWRQGDLLLQYHALGELPAEGASLQIGVYDPTTQSRLPLPDGQQFVIIDPVKQP